MSGEKVGILDYLICLMCVTAVAGGIGMSLGSVINFVDLLSPDYYRKSGGAGLFVAATIIYVGDRSHQLQTKPSKLLFTFSLLMLGMIGSPVVTVTLAGPDELPGDLLYWGLPIFGFMVTATSGIGFIDWDARRGVV